MTSADPRDLPPITIGDAMRLYGMTPRAIRFYEECDLLAAKRDRFNRRYYDATARRRLEWISRLRRAGVGLDDIRHVLETGPDESAQARRARHKLEQRAACLRQALADVTGALDALEPPPRLAVVAAQT